MPETNHKTGRQRFFQYSSLLIFIVLFALAVYPSKGFVPLDIFLRLDPLIAVGTSLASWEVTGKAMVAAVTILVTLLFGRIFCGYICPLGTTIDLGERIFRWKRKRNIKETLEYTRKFGKYRPVKYYLLFAVLASAGLGFTMLFVLDPISLITRTGTAFFYPLVIYISNGVLDVVRPLAMKFGLVTLSHAHFIQPVSGSNLIIFLMFLIIVLSGLVQSRFWCRYLCPLGAFLGICSKTALLKKRISDDCNNCGKCRIQCPMDAIADDPGHTRQAECIQCEMCKTVCPKSAISFGLNQSRTNYTDLDSGFTRRAVITSLLSGFMLGFLGKTNSAHAEITVIRPPGAIPENEFLSRCIRCGECIKACITNTLQPAGLEAGFEALWTPKHYMRHAGCEQQCNMCGQVCPTQAIRPLPLEERKYARVGTAIITRDKCLAWEQNRLCIICDEQCPYNAIVFKMVEGHKRPFVDETKCNGCGICEEKCPVAGKSAIVVSPLGEVRIKHGSYIKEAERLKLTFKAEKDELMENTFPDSDSQESSKPAEKPKLPPGFILD